MISVLSTDVYEVHMKAKEGNNSLYPEMRGKPKYDVSRWRREGKGVSTRGNGKSKVTEAWKYWTPSGGGM